MSHPSRKEILRRLEAKEITSAQAFELLRSSARESAPAALYYHPAWVKADAPAAADKPLGCVLLFDRDGGLRDALRAKAGDHCRAVLVKPGTGFLQQDGDQFEVNPSRPEDYEQLMAALQQRNLLPDLILHAWSDESALPSQLEKGVLSLFSLAKTLTKHPLQATLPILFLHDGQPQYEAVSGFGKSLQQEHPQLLVKTIGRPASQASSVTADQILRERGAEETEVRYEDGVRKVKRYQEFTGAANAPVPLKQRGVYLITGGAGGLGLLFAEHLAQTVQARLVLTGRTAENDSIAQKIKRLESLGGEAVYIQADVTNREDALALVELAKAQFSALDGVLHSAGVLRDSMLRNKPQADMEAVLAPKVFGTVYLDEATQSEPLDFFVLFSSIAGALGNIGQCDYAYGNAFLDAFAAQRDALRAQGKRSGKSLSINWPLWEEGGMQVTKEAVEAMKSTTGFLPLRRETGLAAFEAGLATSCSQWLVLEGDAGKIRSAFSRQEAPAENQAASPRGDDSLLQEKAEEFFKQLLHQGIKIPIEKIHSEDPLDKYGLDSVVVMDLTRELEGSFGTLPKTLFFEYQTLRELTDYFIQKHRAKLTEVIGLAPQAPASAPAPQRAAERTTARSGRPRFASAPAYAVLAKAPEPEKSPDIAIIGMSGRFPQARNLDEYWENLRSGRDCITEIPKDRWDIDKYFMPEQDSLGTMYTKWGGFIDDVDKFDPLFFNISPGEAEMMDPQERIFMEAVWNTIEDAGYDRDRLSQEMVGLFVGVMYGQYQLFGVEAMRHRQAVVAGSSHASVANRVSYWFNFQGPSLALDTMCSSALTSLHLACESIRRGECSLAVAGGVNVSIHPHKYIILSQTRLLSTDGRCRSFAQGGDGYVPGEGVGAVLLKPLDQAVADGDRIYGVIKSTSINHNGRTNGYMVPNPNTQAKLIVNAVKKAGIDPRTISYLEAQATGTPIGDTIEMAGLMRAYSEFTDEKQYCAIGSVKPNIGHLESASGIAALTKVLLQLKHKQLAPTLLANPLNEDIPFADSPFSVLQELRDWERPVLEIDGVKKEIPRRAGISAFGSGGSNAHVIIEEYEPQAAPVRAQGPQVIVLSARNTERLNAHAANLLDYLKRAGLFRTGAQVQKERLGRKVQDDLIAFASELLNLDAQDVDADEQMQEYGFDALTLSELAQRINQAYGLDVSAPDLSALASLNEVAVSLLESETDEIVKHLSGEFALDGMSEVDGKLAEIAFTLQRREALDQRLAIVASEAQELGDKLTRFCAGETGIDGVFTANVEKDGAAHAFDAQRIASLLQNRELAVLAQEWVLGSSVDWTQLYPQGKPARLSLPNYPFARKRYWVSIPEGEEFLPQVPAKPAKADKAPAAPAAPVAFSEDNLEQQVQDDLKRLVAGMLKLPEEEIEVDRNLKVYGFDSLAGMKMISQLEKQLGHKIPLRSFFEFTAIEDMSRYLIENNLVARPQAADAAEQPDFRKQFSEFLLQELQAGRITPDQALEMEQLSVSKQ